MGVLKKTFFNTECAKKTQRTTELKHYFSALCADAEALAQALRPLRKYSPLRLKDFDFLDSLKRKGKY